MHETFHGHNEGDPNIKTLAHRWVTVVRTHTVDFVFTSCATSTRKWIIPVELIGNTHARWLTKGLGKITDVYMPSKWKRPFEMQFPWTSAQTSDAIASRGNQEGVRAAPSGKLFYWCFSSILEKAILGSTTFAPKEADKTFGKNQKSCRCMNCCTSDCNVRFF